MDRFKKILIKAAIAEASIYIKPSSREEREHFKNMAIMQKRKDYNDDWHTIANNHNKTISELSKKHGANSPTYKKHLASLEKQTSQRLKDHHEKYLKIIKNRSTGQKIKDYLAPSHFYSNVKQYD